MRSLLSIVVFWAVIRATLYGADLVGKPVSEFPAQLKLPESGLALITDFQQLPLGSTTVYFVNRSGRSVTLQNVAETGVMPLMLLEYQNTAGEWKRVQWYNFPWCGNKLQRTVEVQHDHFLPLFGKSLAGGHGGAQPAKVRYAFYGQKLKLASNVGEGFIDPPSVVEAQYDDVAFAEGDFVFVASLAAGRTRPQHHDPAAIRLRAIAALGLRWDFDRIRTEQVLQYIVAQKLEPYSSGARNALDDLKRARP